MKVWKGETPKHTIAVKLDGIQAMLQQTNAGPMVVSRSGKQLFNIDPAFLEDGKKYEVYCGSFALTQSIVRSSVSARRHVDKDELYEIFPNTDPRIVLPFKPDMVQDFYRMVTAAPWNAEGLVIDQKYKLKRAETHDVIVTGIIPGKGKNAGKMGALMTTMGKVGAGFTDAQRTETWTVGEVIEVECMELTKSGKFRKPRFKRRRWDKPASEVEK
jgi:hypothetical protein